ncbi:MAG: neocarzinostatin apoprotein domain-containing protein, partial [Acidimicrobiales bacterium]
MNSFQPERLRRSLPRVRPAVRAAAATLTVAALVVGLAPPAISAPSDPEVVTIANNVNLRNGDTVSVTATGFPAEDTLNAVICDDPFRNFDDCAFLTLINPVSDANGEVTFDYFIEELVSDGGNTPIDCDFNNPCNLGVFADVSDTSTNRALTLINYAPPATTTTLP